MTPGDIESAKTALAEPLRHAPRTTTQTLITSLDEGGAPDIDDGDELVDDLVTKFQGFDDAAHDGQDRCRGPGGQRRRHLPDRTPTR